ncbi:acyltransferase family protein [Nocardioides daphniae]|nr:acyltransferase [Nocardioides daphniae]GGD26914.1 hypothetical protein GCM10007231_27920 [Nocardioides daphniae]
MQPGHFVGPSLSALGKEVVARTPSDRDRVVDLVRACALLLVVLGHWLKQGLYVDDVGELRRAGLLGQAEWTHPLTWVFQVMPLVFAVGGFVNGLSWRRESARGTSYGAWLRHRVRRLTAPLVPLMLLWAAAPLVAPAVGLGPDWLHVASKTSLVATWFLAAYLVVVALVPATYALWQRWRWASIIAGVVVAVDVASLGMDLPWVGGLNALVVWGTLHQCGYAWLECRRRASPLLMAGVAGSLLVALTALVVVGPYGVSMVGVDGYGVNNTAPPRLTILVLGCAQVAGVMALEPLLRRLAAVPAIWVAVVLVDRRAMTLYLWHLTCLSLLAAVSLSLGGLGLRAIPASEEWWWGRPAWLLLLLVATVVAVALLGRWEESSPATDTPGSTARAVAEVVAVVTCVAYLASYGVGRQSDGAGGLVALLCAVSVLAARRWDATARRSVTGTSRP